MKPRRIFDLLDRFKTYPQTIGTFKLGVKVSGQWKEYDTEEYIYQSNLVSYGLLSMGIGKDDKIATITNNRPEWNFMDMGIAQIAAVHVPIHPTLSTEEIIFILNHSGARIAVVSDKIIHEKLALAKPELLYLEQVYTFNEVEGAKHWSQITDCGKKNAELFGDKLAVIKEQISENDVLSLIYTSGTTGIPKGVMLTHGNLVSNALASAGRQHLDYKSKALSFLPISHVFERMVNYMYQYLGIDIYYTESIHTIAPDMKELRVNGFITVPRLLESIFEKIIQKARKLSPLKRSIFHWALRLAENYEPYKKQRLAYRIRLSVADKLVFSKWREAMSPEISFIGCGGAALQPRLARLFWAAGLPVFEGYGLTETSPVLAVNYSRPGAVKIGTVGTILEGVSVKIAPDGEILAKGPSIMKGYYKDPEQTAAVIDNEGWFHTGDIGNIENGNFLRVTDRKKEMIKMSNGKYIAPQQIENKLKESFFIEQSMVIGDNQNFASALVQPNFINLIDWSRQHKIDFSNKNELIQKPQVIKHFEEEIRKFNKKLQSFEQVKKIILIADEWSPLTGELSPTLKLKRKMISEKYQDMIKAIYNPSISSTQKVKVRA